MYSIRIMKRKYRKTKSGHQSSAAPEAADPGPRRWIFDLRGVLTERLLRALIPGKTISSFRVSAEILQFSANTNSTFCPQQAGKQKFPHRGACSRRIYSTTCFSLSQVF